MGRPITKVSPFYRRRLLGEAAKAGQALDLQIQTERVPIGFSLRDPSIGTCIAKGTYQVSLRVYMHTGDGDYMI